MTEPGTQVTIKVNGVPRTVTLAEAKYMLENDPMGVIEAPKEGFDSAYRNQDDDWVQERLSAEQVRNQQAVGESPMLLGAQDPRRDLVRQTDARRNTAEMADRYDFLVGMRNFVPGIQYAENYMVGKEEATKARQELITANPITHPFSQLAAFVAAGATGKHLLRGTKYGGAIAAHRSTIGGKTAQLIAEDTLLETYLYSQDLLNNDKEFIAEDWGTQVATGLLFVAPLIGSYAVRAVAGRGLQWGAQRSAAGGVRSFPGVSDALTRAADIGVIKGVMTKSGAKQARIFHTSSGMRVAGRLFRKRKFGAKITKLDMLDEGILANLDEAAEIDAFTPEWFKSRKTSKARRAGVRRLQDLSGEAFESLDNIDFANSVPKARKMHTSINSVPDTLKNTTKDIDLPAGMEGLDDVNEAMYDLKVVEAYDHVYNAGYHDIASELENTFHLDQAKISYGKWAQKRLQAKLQKGPGSEIMDEVARGFLEDPDVWKPQTVARGKKINEAIDLIGDAHDNLRALGDFTDNLDNVDFRTVQHLDNLNQQIENIRQGYRILRQQKMFKSAKMDALVNKLSKVEERLTNGKKAYFDAAQINKAREAAGDLNKAKARELEVSKPKTAAEEKLLREESALEGGSMLVALRDVIAGRLHGLQSTVRTRNTTFGLLAVKHSTTQEERNALYEEVQLNLNELTGNPAALADRLGMLAGDLEVSDPEMSQYTQQKATTAVFYLAANLPKQEQSVYGRDLPPPTSRVNEFIDKMMAVYEPFSVPLMALEGRVTPGMIGAIRNVHPSMYAQMTTVMAGELMGLTPDERRRAPRSTILGIEAFLGGMNPGHYGTNIMQLQSSYAQTAEQQAVIGGTGNTMKSLSPQDSGSNYTATQRVTGF